MEQDALIAILLKEVTITFSRSSGPGGQNVNKVATKAQLIWSAEESRVLTDEQRNAIFQAALTRGYLTTNEKVVIADQHSRSQELNHEAVVEKFSALIRAAFIKKKKRRKTRVPKAQKAARIEAKKRLGEKKKLRGRYS